MPGRIEQLLDFPTNCAYLLLNLIFHGIAALLVLFPSEFFTHSLLQKCNNTTTSTICPHCLQPCPTSLPTQSGQQASTALVSTQRSNSALTQNSRLRRRRRRRRRFSHPPLLQTAASNPMVTRETSPSCLTRQLNRLVAQMGSQGQTPVTTPPPPYCVTAEMAGEQEAPITGILRPSSEIRDSPPRPPPRLNRRHSLQGGLGAAAQTCTAIIEAPPPLPAPIS